ncbi:TDP-N-acetylfucosamine:lipid II N-acetylfucosaminyltransferase, partial [Vibrio owensii]|uniref:TDP-N-acetylfucosamine:lipid II N-acetylfucosaminyltransferase n=1 Tax=Vibrio owensii TaxID=696485 RepID=UPI00215BBCF2
YDYYRHWSNDIYIDYKVKKSCKNKIIESCIRFLNPYNRFDYFSPVLKSEFDSFKKILNARFKYVEWNYGSQRTIIKNNVNLVKKELGTNVMVGNSLDPSNNHYDVLKRIDSNREHIILPISYGGSKSYKSWLLNKLREHDCKTQKLEEFLDSSQYLDILTSCNVLVLNHIRQQGVGNVALALSLGITIYLNKISPLYLELRSKGFHIFETDSISNESDLLRLSTNEIQRNKELSRQHFYYEVEDTKRLIEMVNNEKIV